VADQTVKITIVCDNYEHTPGLETDWGFSCVVKTPQKTILFDTGGDGGILLRNLEKLHIAPADIDIVVLSHDHWDHTGGMRAFLESNPEVTVYLVRSFSKGTKHAIAAAGARIVEVTEPVEICPGIFSTGELPGPPPEHGLVIETEPGLVVITGCAHPGIVRMVARATEMRPAKVHLALGGFHMGGMSDRGIEDVITELRKLGVKRAGPSHCSGDNARRLFAEELGEDYLPLGVGTHLEFSG